MGWLSMRIVHVLVSYVFVVAQVFAGQPLVLNASDGWIREAPPNAPVRAGYVELRNDGEVDIAVIAADSPAFGAIEIHEMVGEGDMMRMRRLRELTVPAGETVMLEPGGKHFMLFRPRQPLAVGDTVMVTLELADGGSAEIELRQR